MSDNSVEAYSHDIELLMQYLDSINHSKLLKDISQENIESFLAHLFDLGLSSPQIDNKDRGFTFMVDAPLDMRMDQSSKLDAETIVNTYTIEELTNIFFIYGEEKMSKVIAKKIVSERLNKKIKTTKELVKIIESAVGAKYFNKNHPERQIFQAIRIEVNGELNVLRNVLPDAIDLLAIHENIYTEPKNAYFTTEPYAVYPEVTGVDFDINKVQNTIDENPLQEEYIVKLDYYTPEITTDDLGMEAFPDLLATYSTRYDASNTNRTTNLRLASNKINGTVIMPGEVFSYNKVVGRRTIAAGYKEAAIYSNGEVTQGLGGGICQISTTLYNAAVGADLKITERRNHMFVPSYVDGGMDATVVYGSQDFKFVNTRDYPIKIESSVSGGIARVKVYGLRTDNEYKITIESKTVKNSSNSFVVEAYKVYRQDGEVIKRERISRDTYKKQ